jgi:hypothetical protein
LKIGCISASPTKTLPYALHLFFAAAVYAMIPPPASPNPHAPTACLPAAPVRAPRVFIKLAKTGVFASVDILPGDVVSDLAARACTQFPHWRAKAAGLSLFLVAEGGEDTPSEEDTSRPLQGSWPLARAGIAPGAWVVARGPRTPIPIQWLIISLCLLVKSGSYLLPEESRGLYFLRFTAVMAVLLALTAEKPLRWVLLVLCVIALMASLMGHFSPIEIQNAPLSKWAGGKPWTGAERAAECVP